MAFLSKIKQFFGAGTVKVALTAPASVEKTAGQFAGKVVLTAASDQHVLEVTVILEEEWTSGRGENKTVKTFELGKVVLATAFDMKAGEEKAFDYVLPFELVKSNADQLKERGGALGALGAVSALAGGEKSTYKVKADADVKGAAFDPSDAKEIRLV